MGFGAQPKGRVSLKARAVSYLSRREHSRLELERKLAGHCDDPAAIAQVLDELVAQGWQSDERYTQAYMHAKAARHGTARIVQALRQQGIAADDLDRVRQTLQQTEYHRAQQVWQARFGQSPMDTRGYARQYRFLAGRGFSADVIRQVLGAPERDF